MTCCATFENAQNGGTDNEGYGALIHKFRERFHIGSELPEMEFCPWCGKKLIHNDEEPKGMK